MYIIDLKFAALELEHLRTKYIIFSISKYDGMMNLAFATPTDSKKGNMSCSVEVRSVWPSFVQTVTLPVKTKALNRSACIQNYLKFM